MFLASLFTCGTLLGDMSTMYEPCAHGSLGEVLQIRLDRCVLTTRCSVLCGGDSRTFGNEFGDLAAGRVSADVAAGAVPVRLAQFAFEDLAGAGDGQRVGEGDAAGELVAGDLSAAELPQFLAGDFPARLQDHDGVHPLAPCR